MPGRGIVLQSPLFLGNDTCFLRNEIELRGAGLIRGGVPAAMRVTGDYYDNSFIVAAGF